ncbi:MAG TPA: alpha/beta hydrolase [Chloroflexia bacterium]|nr:alpha/beta hydrolase [Chloroflexia bacterium]
MESTINPQTIREKKEYSSRFSTGQVTSADGTIIGYRQIGIGPGLLVLHGGARAGHHYVRLAQALADAFTVYLPDRRGRGLSGPAGENYSLQKELEDVSALLEQTGAQFIFGHSAGGFFALEAAVTLKVPITKLVLYEPAVSINGSLPLGWLPRFEAALGRKDYVTAVVIFFKGLSLNSLSRVPDWILSPFVRIILRGEEGQELIDLLPTFVREVKEFQRSGLSYERYQNITAKTLLFGGARSPDYLRQGIRTLAKIIPQSWLIELPKLDHNSPDQNAPEVVASELKEFFA